MLGDDAGIVAASVADSGIDVLAPEVRERDARPNVEVDVRMRGQEVPDARQQPSRGERRHHADAPLAWIVVLGDLAYRFGQLRQRDAHASRESLALVGQPDAASGALDQLHAKVVLERLQLMADGAVRDMHSLRRLGQAAGTRHGFERAQRLHRGYPSRHRQGLYVSIF